MQFVEMNDVLLRTGTPLVAPPGSTTLVDSNAGALIAIGPREGYEDLVLGFEIAGADRVETNWPLRPSFPTFVLNVLRYLGGGRHTASALATVRPGQPVVLLSEANSNKLNVVTPSGRSIPLTLGVSNEFNFTDTEELGVYTVQESDRELRRFAVNLFDRQESNLVPRSDESIRLGHREIPPRAEPEAGRREGWKYLLLAAVAILLLEWYIYNRRVYV